MRLTLSVAVTVYAAAASSRLWWACQLEARKPSAPCEVPDPDHMGLSENSVPLHPMVNSQISLLNGYNWGYTPFSDIPILKPIFFRIQYWNSRINMNLISRISRISDKIYISIHYWKPQNFLDQTGSHILRPVFLAQMLVALASSPKQERFTRLGLGDVPKRIKLVVQMVIVCIVLY